MCHTESQQQIPLNTAGSGPVPGNDPLSAAIQKENAANPQTVSVTAPTKFGKLLKLVQPMIEGAAIGGFTGRGHPGGGFGAVTDYYAARHERDVRDAMLQHTLQNDQFKNALEQARTIHELGRPNFSRPATVNAKDGQGNPVILRTNPTTGEMEPVDGYTPFDKSEDNVTTHETDQGLIGVNKQGNASRISLPGPSQKVATPTGPKGVIPGNRYSGANASPSTVTQAPSTIPLGPPDRQYKDTLRDKAADAIRTKHPDWTEDQVFAQVQADARKPDDNGQLTGAKYNTARQKIQTRLDTDMKGSETTRTKEIAALKKDLTLPDDERDAQTQQIENDNADRKQQIHQKYADEAEAMGIDLGQVPNYRSQVGGGQPKSGNPIPRGGGNASARVNVIRPDGTPGTIPQSQLAAAKKKGYKVSQ